MHNKTVIDMFDGISGKYDFFNNLFSLGIHQRWKKKVGKYVPKGNNLSHLDIATGTGDLLISLAKHPSIHKQIGVDGSEKMLSIAQTKIERYNLNAKLVCADVIDLPFDDQSINFVTLSFGLRNFTNLPKATQEIRRIMAPNGRLCILEFSRPQYPLIKQTYDFYLKKVMPMTAGLFSKKKPHTPTYMTPFKNFPLLKKLRYY